MFLKQAALASLESRSSLHCGSMTANNNTLTVHPPSMETEPRQYSNTENVSGSQERRHQQNVPSSSMWAEHSRNSGPVPRPSVNTSAFPARSPTEISEYLPPNWERRMDTLLNRLYYLNIVTGKTQWNAPQDLPSG